MKYVIRWKSKVNGRAGRGTKEFSHDEAQQLADELNREYPDIEHEPIPAPPPQARAEEPHAHAPASDSHSEEEKPAKTVEALSAE